MGRRVLSVLVVDDSAVVRQAATTILSQDPGMVVTVAADPYIALDKMGRSRPDVILLDIEMPRMDGLTFLRKIMTEDPIPVVVCSGLAARGTATAIRALEEGAVEVIAKPQLGVRDFLHDSADTLIEVVREAAEVRVRRRQVSAALLPRHSADVVLPPVAATPQRRRSDRRGETDLVVAIGASTGGTEALRTILTAMPEDAPGMVIVQHMPERFTAAFAQRLDQLCRIEVKEAAAGDRVQPGRALIAPGNRHLVLRRHGPHYEVELSDGPRVSRHRPSVDVLFRSVAQTAGAHALGVLLTGMGDDGATGLLEMKRAGAATVAQDERSSVVFGMPKEAIERGAADRVLPLSHMAGAILTAGRTSAR
jgi:two-component system chemotaxis response regulator CheB